ncbi:MAG: ABC transporter permease, partial [Deltaproteobacteria bacterium]|nr:ABC transporter permease [Deltaproteobacteria bacterium]
LREMLVKEFIQVLRNPRMKFLLLVMPTVQILLYGYAATNDVRNVPTAVYDLDNTSASRDLAARFAASGHFQLGAPVTSEAEVRDLLDRGKATALLRVNRGFEEDLGAGRTAQVQLLLDGTDSNTASIVLDYASRIVAGYSQELLTQRVVRRGGAAPRPAVTLVSRAWFNENLESRNFFVPGTIGNLVLIITLSLTSMAVVREREVGTMEQLMVTPLRPLELIIGKTLPFALLGLLDVFLISFVGVLWFDVPMRGSPLVLLLGSVLFLVSTLGAGLLISTAVKTQQQAMMTTFFFTLPAILLSGFSFPIANMPRVVQWITFLNPLRYYLVIIRSVFLKGVGVDVLWPELLGLAILGPITLGLAATRFRKTLS